MGTELLQVCTNKEISSYYDIGAVLVAKDVSQLICITTNDINQFISEESNATQFIKKLEENFPLEDDEKSNYKFMQSISEKSQPRRSATVKEVWLLP